MVSFSVADLVEPQLCCHLILGIFFIFLCYFVNNPHGAKSITIVKSFSLLNTLNSLLIHAKSRFQEISPSLIKSYGSLKFRRCFSIQIIYITKCRFVLFVNRRINNSLSSLCINLVQILCKYCANIMKILYIYCENIMQIFCKYYVFL